MPQILTLPPSAEPISLSEAKAHLRVTHADDDTYISSLISAARRMIEQKYGLALLQQNWSYFQDAWPKDGIFNIPIFPLMSVIDVFYYGDDDAASVLDHAHYYVDAASRPSRLVLRNGRSYPAPGKRVNGIEVKFSAGFGTTASSVPQTIRQALLMMISDWYAARGDVDAGQMSLSAQSMLAAYNPVRLI